MLPAYAVEAEIGNRITCTIPGFTPSAEVRQMILAGTAKPGIYTDTLHFKNVPAKFSLPPDLKAAHIFIDNCPEFQGLPERLLTQSVEIRRCSRFEFVPTSLSCSGLVLEDCKLLEALPPDLDVSSLALVRCRSLRKLPAGLGCHHLRISDCPIETLPSDLRVDQTLEIQNTELRSIPRLRAWRINLSGCTELRHLGNPVEAQDLNLTGCTSFQWPDFAMIEVGRLNLCECVQITYLPDWLLITESIDLANARIAKIPASLKKCALLWKGVPIDERIAFRPEEIGTDEILTERNAEKRRVLLERMGWEKFLGKVDHRVLHRDTDPGGERRLLKFTFSDNEDVVVLTVNCPSTGRRYFIRVPPLVETCHQAAAWIAGFDDPKLYEPVVET